MCSGGVAPWAGGDGLEGGPVLEEVELKGRFEGSGGDEKRFRGWNEP